MLLLCEGALMSIIKLIILGLVILIASSDSVNAQGWRGIMPMRSTCKDVKKILGVDTCAPPDETYDLDGEKVKISFTKRQCEPAYQKFWDVPVGTVVIIERHLQKIIPLADFHIDESKYEKSYNDMVGHVIYSHKDEGISYWTVNGEVYLIFYTPRANASKFECPKGKALRSQRRRGKL
jgi:hypothetical protein